MTPRRLELTVTAELAGQKVDHLLRRVLGLSGSVIRHFKRVERGITLDDTAVFTNVLVREGQLLSVQVGDAARKSEIPPIPGPLDILYEDADLVVVNKAPGVPSHPGPGHWDDTLGNFLLAHYDAHGETHTDFHPAHRLDKGTSGLMVVAKHPHAQEMLKTQLHSADFRRIYLAVCEGALTPGDAGVIDAPLGPVDTSKVEQEVRPDGKTARTRFEVLKSKGGRSLLRLELETGRTHQIRVHMAHIGCPLTGDFLYGTEDKELIARPALHSAELSFCHPISREVLCFVLPLPEDMVNLMQ